MKSTFIRFPGRHLITLGVLATCGHGGLLAQDPRSVQPQPVPRQVSAGDQPVPTDLRDFAARAGAMAEEDVILERLRGIVFLAEPGQARPTGYPEVAGFDASRVPALQADGFEIVAYSFLEQGLSRESLLRLQAAVKFFLGQQGFPYTSVYLPPQDITDGVIQVVAQPSLADKEVRVEGANWFSDRNYRAAIRQQPGQPIDDTQLKADIDWLNRNPFRRVAVVTRAGASPNTTVLDLQTLEHIPLRVYGGYNNTGTAATQEDRLFVGMNWGNAFGRADQLGFQFTASPDFRTSLSGSANYTHDFPWRHTLRLIAALSELDSNENPPLALHGRSWQIGLRYEIPLPDRARRIGQSLEIGLDFKSSDNNLLFSSIPVTDNLTHVAQASLSYRLSIPDRRGQTSLGATLFAAPGGLTHRNRDATFDASRSGASADYVYATVDLRRQTLLPAGLVWSIKGRLQLASENLIGSEQFAAGGSASVRGYEEGEVYADQGLLLSHELILPGFSLLSKVVGREATDTLQPYLFQDYAQARSVRPLPGEDSFKLHSVGAGLRYQLGPSTSVQAAYGWQLRDSGGNDGGDNARLHLSANLSF